MGKTQSQPQTLPTELTTAEAHDSAEQAQRERQSAKDNPEAFAELLAKAKEKDSVSENQHS